MIDPWWPVVVLAVIQVGDAALYFVIAIGMHVRARDFGRNLFANATGMLVLCTATLVYVVASG